MGFNSIWHWLILGAVLLLVFGGKGKISDIMGDFAKGIKSFKKGMADETADVAAKAGDAAKTIDHKASATADAVQENRKAG